MLICLTSLAIALLYHATHDANSSEQLAVMERDAFPIWAIRSDFSSVERRTIVHFVAALAQEVRQIGAVLPVTPGMRAFFSFVPAVTGRALRPQPAQRMCYEAAEAETCTF